MPVIFRLPVCGFQSRQHNWEIESSKWKIEIEIKHWNWNWSWNWAAVVRWALVNWIGFVCQFVYFSNFWPTSATSCSRVCSSSSSSTSSVALILPSHPKINLDRLHNARFRIWYLHGSDVLCPLPTSFWPRQSKDFLQRSVGCHSPLFVRVSVYRRLYSTSEKKLVAAAGSERERRIT